MHVKLGHIVLKFLLVEIEFQTKKDDIQQSTLCLVSPVHKHR